MNRAIRGGYGGHQIIKHGTILYILIFIIYIAGFGNNALYLLKMDIFN